MSCRYTVNINYTHLLRAVRYAFEYWRRLWNNKYNYFMGCVVCYLFCLTCWLTLSNELMPSQSNRFFHQMSRRTFSLKIIKTACIRYVNLIYNKYVRRYFSNDLNFVSLVLRRPIKIYSICIRFSLLYTGKWHYREKVSIVCIPIRGCP